MRFTYVAKQYKITEGLKEAVESKMDRCKKYLRGENTAKVVMSTVKGHHKLEITILTKDYVVRAEETNEDMYAAIDLIIDKLERSLRKNKEKINSKGHDSIRYEHDSDIDSIVDEESSLVVKRKTVGVKPMTEEEAILQMNLLNHDFFVFKDISDVIKILYKRKDGQYGVIESV